MAKSLRNVLVGLACLGLILPVRTAPAAQLPGETAFPILDVELGPQGRLTGTLVDVLQNPLSQPVVVVAHPGGQRRPVVARNGNFFVDALPGGVYVVVTTGATMICRCWAYGTAPPAAVKQLRIVAGNGGKVAEAKSLSELFLSPPALIGIGLTIAAGIAVPIAVHYSKRDAS